MDKMTRVKMMTATILLVVATVVCGQRQKARPQQNANWTDSVAAYRQLARQGDKEARLKLAHCYRLGHGVERDYLTMASLVAMESDEKSIELFYQSLPDDDVCRLIHDGTGAAMTEDDEMAFLCMTKLETMEVKEAGLIRKLRAATGMDMEEKVKLVYQNVDEDGSVLELTMACVVAIEEGNCEWAMNTLHRLTKTSPVVWSMLAMLYRCESQVRNDSLTKVCLAKADEYALLSDYDQKKLDGE